MSGWLCRAPLEGADRWAHASGVTLPPPVGPSCLSGVGKRALGGGGLCPLPSRRQRRGQTPLSQQGLLFKFPSKRMRTNSRSAWPTSCLGNLRATMGSSDRTQLL